MANGHVFHKWGTVMRMKTDLMSRLFSRNGKEFSTRGRLETPVTGSLDNSIDNIDKYK